MNTAKELLKIKAVEINTENLFTWVSGIKSPIYTDNRLICSFPASRQIIENEFAALVKKEFPDAEILLGTATAGIAHAALVANILNLPMGYIRSSKKEHGKQNRIEGLVPQGAKVVIIEDLLSTGKSSLEAVEAAQAAGANVLGVAAIFSYNLLKLRVNFANTNYATITNVDELLQVAKDENLIQEKDIAIVQTFLEGLGK